MIAVPAHAAQSVVNTVVAAGVTAVVDCGVAPGLSNMMAGRAAARLEVCERVEILVGGLPLARGAEPAAEGVLFVATSMARSLPSFPYTDAWFEDPTNPYHRWVDGFRNSRLIVEDCTQSYLRLVHRPEVDGGELHEGTVKGSGNQGRYGWRCRLQRWNGSVSTARAVTVAG